MELGVDPKTAASALEGALPWLAPTGEVAREALKQLDRPLLCWQDDPEVGWFDSADFYAEYADEPGGLSRLERKISKLPPRLQWSMERVWQPDEESSPEEEEAYAKASVTIAGYQLHPRCLDAYTTIAYDIAGLHNEEDFLAAEGSRVPGDLDTALDWATAGVAVLQQSLPYPFRDVLLYGNNDNRPAHRILYAYASLLRLKHPRTAAPWFTALVYLNPMDNVGARFVAPGGPSYPR